MPQIVGSQPTLSTAPVEDGFESVPDAWQGTPLFSFGPWLWASFAVLLAGILVISGLGLLFFYQPAPGMGTESLVDLDQATGFSFLRAVHFWAGHGLLLAAWLHLARVFAVGSYRRRLGWRVTVALVVLVTLEAWMGEHLASSSLDKTSLLAAYTAHILIVPGTIAGLVFAWAQQRSRRVRAVAPSTVAPALTADLEDSLSHADEAATVAIEAAADDIEAEP